MPFLSLSFLHTMWDYLWTSFIGIFVFLIGLIGAIFTFVGVVLPIVGLVVSILALLGKDMSHVEIKVGKWKMAPVWAFPVAIVAGLILFGIGYLFTIGAGKGLTFMLPYMRF